MAGRENQPGVIGALLRGLSTSVTGNAQAFGFSVTVTVTFGMVNITEGDPSRFELFGFAMAAVAAFSLLNLAVFPLIHNNDRANVERAKVIGTATDFFAVGAAVGAAMGTTALVHGWAAWLLAPFLAGLTYVLAQAIEMTLGRSEANES